MPRYVMELLFSVRIQDENGDDVDCKHVIQEMTIASKSKGVAEIIDSASSTLAEDIANEAKKIFQESN